MMKESSVPYDLYTPLAEHSLVGVHHQQSNVNDTHNPLPHHQVTLLNQKTGEQRRFDVSYCAILIGSRPDLRLLRNVNQARIQLGSSGANTIGSPSNHSTTSTTSSVYEHLSNTLRLFDSVNGKSTVPSSSSPSTLPTSSPEHWLLGRKLSWLKSLCAKCRTMNFCEWTSTTSSTSSSNGRRQEHHRKSSCYNTTLMPTLVNVDDAKKPTTTNTTLLLSARRRSSAFAAAQKIEDVAAATGETPNAQPFNCLQLGEDPCKPIDCKTNPIAVNKYTNEVQRLASGRRGLYAMGPLVGDNFVRFISGGALAITSALHREND